MGKKGEITFLSLQLDGTSDITVTFLPFFFFVNNMKKG